MTSLSNYYLGCYSIQNSVSLPVVRNENIVSVASCISFCQSASSPTAQPTITLAGVSVFAPSILHTNIATCFCWSDSIAILKSNLDPTNCGACLDDICGLRGSLSTSYAVYSLVPVVIPAPPDPATAVTSTVDPSAILNVGGTVAKASDATQAVPTSEVTSPDMGQPTFISTLNPSLSTSDTLASAVINPMVMTPTESPTTVTSTTSTITKPTATTTMKMPTNPIQYPTTATMGGGGGGVMTNSNNTSTSTTAVSESSVTLSTSPFSVFLIAVIVLGTVVGLMFTMVPYYYYYYHDKLGKHQRLFSFTSSGNSSANSKNGSYSNITNTNSNPRPRFRDLLPAITPLMQGRPISPALATPTTPTQLIRPNAISPKSGSASPPVPPKISTSPTSRTTTTPTNHAFNNSQFTITNLVSTTIPSPSLASQSMILTSPSLASNHMRDSISVAGGGGGGGAGGGGGPGSEVASTLTIESSIAVGNSGLYRFSRAGGPVVVLVPPEYPPPVALPESS